MDDPRWGELDHAYGKASDTPALLEALRACALLPGRWQDEPLSPLWESLCHQGDPCTAAHAAVPHLVETVAERPAGEGDFVLHLIGAIAAHAHRGPSIPSFLLEAYEGALSRTADLIRDWLSHGPVDSRRALLLLADHAAVSGERLFARAMMALEPGEVDFACAECRYRGMLGVGDGGLEIEPLEWTQRASGAVEGSAHAAYQEWAVALGHAALARQIADLDAAFACPGCGRALRAIDAIVAAYP